MEGSLGFRLFFVGKHECDVEMIEVEHIDFDDVKRRVVDGKSVFITIIPEVN